MNASPLTAARQIRAAKEAADERLARKARQPRLAFSTETGDARDVKLSADSYRLTRDESDVAFCFVCNRCTDHVGEHDDLLDAGLAEYVAGDVRRTALSFA